MIEEGGMLAPSRAAGVVSSGITDHRVKTRFLRPPSFAVPVAAKLARELKSA
jgi:hypothetical protein